MNGLQTGASSVL